MICVSLRTWQRCSIVAVGHNRSVQFLLERMPRRCKGAKVANQGDHPIWGRRSPVVFRGVIVRKHGTVKSRVSTFINRTSKEVWYIVKSIWNKAFLTGARLARDRELNVCGSPTGITKAHQTVQHSIIEHTYAARWQHSRTGERFGKPTSLDWIDAVWLLIRAISITSPFVKRGRSRMHCNACISSSTSMSSLVSMWDRVWNPGGSRKKFGENGSLVHWSSAKVVWSTMRLDPARIEEFRSCLSASVRVGHKNIASLLTKIWPVWFLQWDKRPSFDRSQAAAALPPCEVEPETSSQGKPG